MFIIIPIACRKETTELRNFYRAVYMLEGTCFKTIQSCLYCRIILFKSLSPRNLNSTACTNYANNTIYSILFTILHIQSISAKLSKRKTQSFPLQNYTSECYICNWPKLVQFIFPQQFPYFFIVFHKPANDYGFCFGKHIPYATRFKVRSKKLLTHRKPLSPLQTRASPEINKQHRETSAGDGHTRFNLDNRPFMCRIY